MQYTVGLNHFIYGIVTQIKNSLIMNNIKLTALEDLPYIEPGDDLAEIIFKSFRSNNINLDDPHLSSLEGEAKSTLMLYYSCW